MKHLKLILLAVVTFSTEMLIGQAEETKSNFSLNEAVEYALTNSYFTRSAMMDVTMAEQKVKEITGMGLPQISASAGYSHYFDIPTSLVPANSFDPTAPADEFAELQFGTKSNMDAGISVNQMIFDGAYVIGLKASKTYRELAYASKAKTDAEIKRDVVKAYGLAIVSKLNLEYVRENEAKLKTLVDENTAMYEVGFMEEKDLDQVKLLLLNTQSVLIQTENTYKVSLDMLKFTMGKPIAEDIVLTDDVEKIKKPFVDKSNNLNAKLIMEEHVDYHTAFMNLQYQDLTLSNEKVTYYPKLYGFLNYQGNSFGNDFNHFSSDGKWFPTSLIGLKLDIPIFSGGSRHQRVQQAQVGYEKAELQLQQTEQGLFLDLANKRNSYEAAMNKLENVQKNLELSARIKDQTRIKYKEGTSSNVELTQTENQFLQSQTSYVMAMYEVITTKAELDYALGKK
ncbi:MAG: TolC family protein [Salibacteraceae bacterium]